MRRRKKTLAENGTSGFSGDHLGMCQNTKRLGTEDSDVLKGSNKTLNIQSILNLAKAKKEKAYSKDLARENCIGKKTGQARRLNRQNNRLRTA